MLTKCGIALTLLTLCFGLPLDAAEPEAAFGTRASLLASADAAFAADDSVQAEALLAEIALHYPQDVTALTRLGLIYAKSGREGWAKDVFAEVMRRAALHQQITGRTNPDSPGYW